MVDQYLDVVLTGRWTEMSKQQLLFTDGGCVPTGAKEFMDSAEEGACLTCYTPDLHTGSLCAEQGLFSLSSSTQNMKQ